MAKSIYSGLLAASITAMAAGLPAAHAATATQAEADRLTTVFERYAGHPAAGQPGTVTVTPEGSSYRANFDIKRAFRALETYNVTLDDAALTLLLTPQDNGTWHVTSDAFPAIIFHAGPQTTKVQSTNYKFDGTFDPKIPGFSDATTSVDASSVDQEAPNLTQHQRTEKTTTTQKGAVDGAGASSMSLHYAVTGLTDDMVVIPPPPDAAVPEGQPAPPPPAPVTMSYRTPSAFADVSVDKVRMQELLDLWAFFVAHPNHDSIVDAQEELRGLLRGVLPILGSLTEKAALDQFALSTPVGAFGARHFGADLELADLSSSGKAAMGLTLDGLTVPVADLPPWSLGLIPTSVALKTTLTGFHLDEAAKQAVDQFDLKGDGLTPEQRQKIGQTIWPAEGGKVVLAPSRLTSPLLDVQFDGEATLSAGAPAGRLTVISTGLDKVITTLQSAAATDPSVSQILTQVVVAKNLAKPGPDGSLIWVLEGSANGPLMVNGVPLK